MSCSAGDRLVASAAKWRYSAYTETTAGTADCMRVSRRSRRNGDSAAEPRTMITGCGAEARVVGVVLAAGSLAWFAIVLEMLRCKETRPARLLPAHITGVARYQIPDIIPIRATRGRIPVRPQPLVPPRRPKPIRGYCGPARGSCSSRSGARRLDVAAGDDQGWPAATRPRHCPDGLGDRQFVLSVMADRSRRRAYRRHDCIRE